MTIYQEKLEELGLTEDQLSGALKKKVREFNRLFKEVDGIKENLDSGELEDEEYESVKDDYEEALDNLEELDEALAKEIHVYNRRSQNYKAKKEPKAEETKSEEPKAEGTDGEQPKAEEVNADGTQEVKKGKNTPFLLGALLVILSGGLAYKFLKK